MLGRAKATRDARREKAVNTKFRKRQESLERLSTPPSPAEDRMSLVFGPPLMSV
jgi:hypothetical protein